MSGRNLISLAALLVALVGPATAGTVFDESTNGDFSGNRTAPTGVSFQSGANDIFGVTGNTAGVPDRDYFTFVIPHGFFLKSLTVLDSQLAAGGSAFIGLQSGGQVTVDPAAASAAPLLGYLHFAPGDIGTDILPEIGTGIGAQGFTPPLGEGTYSAWIQDGHPAPSIYGLRFAIVPGPDPVVLTLTGFAFLAGMGILRTRAGRRGTSLRHGCAPAAP